MREPFCSNFSNFELRDFGKFGKFGVETAVEFRGSFESQPVIQDTEQAQLLQRSFWDSWDLRYLRPWQSDKMDFCMIYV